MKRVAAVVLVLVAACGAAAPAHAADADVRAGRIDTVVKVGRHLVDVDKPRGTLVATLDWRGSDRARTLRPCRNEDSPNCYWWAQQMGDGAGDSFVDLRGRVYYWRR